MQTLTKTDFDRIIKDAEGIKLRVKKELKFVKSTEELRDDWSEYELIAISDRTGSSGVVLLQPYDDLYVAQYELSHKIIDAKTGRGRAIICDFCYTWQQGANAASITFTHMMTKSSVSFLCCDDLACSQHVRTLTKEGLVSRTQLRESLDNEGRVDRLKERLQAKIHQLELTAVTL